MNHRYQTSAGATDRTHPNRLHAVPRAYEIQRSCDSRTWATVMTVFGTGGLQRLPLTADTDQAHYRVRE